MKLELGDDTVAAIVVDVLKTDLKINQKAVADLEKKSKLTNFQETDLADSLMLVNALKRILKYYGHDAR